MQTSIAPVRHVLPARHGTSLESGVDFEVHVEITTHLPHPQLYSFSPMTTYIPSLTLPAAILENPAISILLPIAAGTAIGYATRPSETQNTYLAIRQPPLRPPPWVFGPAWTCLYGAMGYAAHRAWTTGTNSFDPHKLQLAKVISSCA